jgi:hypothetical protein
MTPGYAPPTPPTQSTVGLPTCASIDYSTTVPQGILIAGGGIATLVGVIGAIFSEDYRKEFAVAAGAGLVSSLLGGIWAAASMPQLIQNQWNPQCTGPGVAWLDGASVNSDQTTPPGQVPTGTNWGQSVGGADPNFYANPANQSTTSSAGV